jgi:AAA+ superfamily predicted ATPase
MDPMMLLNHCAKLSKHVIIAENYENFFNDVLMIQLFLNRYQEFKINQVCFVIVGHTSKAIPPVLKQCIAILDFKLPDRKEIETSATALSKQFKKAIDDAKAAGSITKEDHAKADFSVTQEVVESCLALSLEELENALAFSARTQYRFDPKIVIERKRAMLRNTGFLDFIEPEPIDNLGGMDEFKAYVEKRLEPFHNPESIKPKLRSILLVGVQGCGKSLASKILCSIFNYPGIIFDIGATKGMYLGQTGENLRLGTKIIDAIGRSIVVLDEIEKAVEQTEFGGGKQSGGGAIADMIGHMLTWMQERRSEAIVVATSNNLNALPPEFLRAGRWDRIFFVGLPNPYEIQTIIKIHNRKWKAELPTDLEFCKVLWKGKWSGAEIEQLAKDSHYDDIESCMRKIPILAIYKATDIDRIINDKKYSPASIEYAEPTPKGRKVSLQ